MKNIRSSLITLHIVVWGIRHRFFVLLLIGITFGGVAISCPTCIGTIEQNSPKFFSNDAYRLNHHVQEVQIDHVNTPIKVGEENE